MWVATIHLEVLVHVRGLDMQVSSYLAVLQVDPRVEGGNFFCQTRNRKFDGRMMTVEVIN